MSLLHDLMEEQRATYLYELEMIRRGSRSTGSECSILRGQRNEESQLNLLEIVQDHGS